MDSDFVFRNWILNLPVRLNTIVPDSFRSSLQKKVIKTSTLSQESAMGKSLRRIQYVNGEVSSSIGTRR